MVGKLQHDISNHSENQAFFNYFYSKVFFLILVNVCWKYAYGNIRIIASFFFFVNIFFILLSTYLENTGRNIILCVKMLLLRNKSHVLIWMIVVKIEM